MTMAPPLSLLSVSMMRHHHHFLRGPKPQLSAMMTIQVSAKMAKRSRSCYNSSCHPWPVPEITSGRLCSPQAAQAPTGSTFGQAKAGVLRTEAALQRPCLLFFTLLEAFFPPTLLGPSADHTLERAWDVMFTQCFLLTGKACDAYVGS